jgi:small subunit ribosomal protein S20
MRRSRIRTFLRKVEEAIASGDNAAARAALQAAQPELMRGVTKGVVNKNTAARKMSRLSARVKATAASAAPAPPPDSVHTAAFERAHPDRDAPFLLSEESLAPPRFPGRAKYSQLRATPSHVAT